MALSRTRVPRPAPRPVRPVADRARTLQAAKAAQTRARLIDATVRCLVKHGYANTTTPKVAEEAGLSRGAMVHHFENGSALIKAAITELLAGLDAGKLAAAVEIARLPEDIRGYGHVKARHLAAVRPKWDRLMAQWRAGGVRAAA